MKGKRVLTEEEVQTLVRPFVREFREASSAPLQHEMNIGLIVGHGSFPFAASAPVSAVIRFGTCVSVAGIVGLGLAGVPAAMAIEQAFKLARGRALRFLKFEDAAVLDWCWKSVPFNNVIDNHTVRSSYSAIQATYELSPDFDDESVIGSLRTLDQNGSIEAKPSDRWRLVEDVKIFR